MELVSRSRDWSVNVHTAVFRVVTQCILIRGHNTKTSNSDVCSNHCFVQSVETGCEVHSFSYSMGTRFSAGGNMAGA
jgi:hypothetical protein